MFAMWKRTEKGRIEGEDGGGEHKTEVVGHKDVYLLDVRGRDGVVRECIKRTIITFDGEWG
jgi:hypothetical protein